MDAQSQQLLTQAIQQAVRVSLQAPLGAQAQLRAQAQPQGAAQTRRTTIQGEPSSSRTLEYQPSFKVRWEGIGVPRFRIPDEASSEAH